MYLDAQNLFSDNQAITATAASTNVIDLGVARDVGPGAPLNLDIRVSEAFNTLTSLTVDIETDSTAAFTTPTVLASQTKLLVDIDAVGDTFNLTFMPDNTEQFVRLNYTVAGVAPTTGKINAGLVVDRQSAS